MSEPVQERHNAKDLLFAVLVMIVYFAYMLTIAFAPDLFAAPVAEGSALSIGLLAGVLMAVFMVAFCAWYTWRRNRSEREESTTTYPR
jgi:uncharacterized membrane protein (DUF485 family)